MPSKPRTAKYATANITDVPHSRNGKHNGIMDGILGDLEDLRPGMAMKVPLKDLRFSKEKIRSALNRATTKQNITVATASDSTFLYIWKTDGK